MPLPITIAHKLSMKLSQVRKKKELSWVRPDGKSQVSVIYEDYKPTGIDTIVISTQHAPDINLSQLREEVIDKVIKPVCGNWIDSKTKFLVNPTGRFVIGGPPADTGLTGRKIIADTYGGMGRHGGGALSGKDPSKVDRSACYMARYVAKNIVAAGLADKCEVQFAYAIGVAEPVSIMVDTFGTGRVREEVIEDKVRKSFDMTPAGIINILDLKRPIYKKTATYGHFGRNEPSFTWENIDKVSSLLK
jgi:S-adenosylmethionine synthetase